MMGMRQKNGFTVVELIIVISVIGILSAIGYISYSGATDRARNTQRLSDMKNITESLAIYKQSHKQFPDEQSSGNWENSYEHATDFIAVLKTSGLVKDVPVDPQNSSQHYYRYMRYPAGTSGCNAASGDFYVLQIINTKDPTSKADDNPGFSCSGHNWTNDNSAWFTIGAYVVD
jgi:prepilin-type N-terminal cleavage/methylation domain-containing protein